MQYNLEVISPYRNELGEGPHWDETAKRLYHVDLTKGDAYLLDPVTKAYESVHLPEALTLIVPIAGSPGQFIASQNRSIGRLEWASKKFEVLGEVDDGLDTRINDGKCDRKGRLWYGTMNWERKPGVFEKELGSLYCMDGKRKITKKQDKITISNGLAWSSDNKKFYFIDSLTHECWVYDYDLETGNISNRKTVFDFKIQKDLNPKAVPDGMTIDTADKIWIASFNGSSVTRIDPETGKILGIIKVPASKTTSATFGGEDFRTMYITSAQFGLSESELKAEPEAGAVFKVTFEKENIKGYPNEAFRFQ